MITYHLYTQLYVKCVDIILLYIYIDTPQICKKKLKCEKYLLIKGFFQ